MTATTTKPAPTREQQVLSDIGLWCEIDRGNGCCSLDENGTINTDDGLCCMSGTARSVFDRIAALGGPSLAQIIAYIDHGTSIISPADEAALTALARDNPILRKYAKATP